MAADIDLTGATPRIGPAKTLFRLNSPGYYPADNGKRFLVFEPAWGALVEPPMVIVQNWAAGLGN